jgi:hypothetical protein
MAPVWTIEIHGYFSTIVTKVPPMDPILSSINTIHILMTYLSSILSFEVIQPKLYTIIHLFVLSYMQLTSKFIYLKYIFYILQATACMTRNKQVQEVQQFSNM